MPISLIKEEEHILRVLPVLLRKDDHFRREVSIVLSEAFATKGDLKQILEEIQKSREETAKRFAEQREETNKRFEAVDKRFEEMHKEMHLGFEITNKRIEDQGVSLTKRIDKVGMSVRAIGLRWGIETEITIRNTLRELLVKKLDVSTVSEWKTRDKKGIVGVPNSDIQADLLLRNGQHYLAEIKSSADTAHVNRLYKIGELYADKEKVKPKLLFIAVIMDEKGKKLCEELGIQLITYDELED